MYCDSLSAISILLVHPHPPTQERVGRILRTEGYHVRVVGCGNDAIMLTQRHRLDAVLLDISGPPDRSLAVLTALQIETPRLPVLLLAGTARSETIASALDLGALTVLPAPYDIDILNALLRRALTIGTMAARAEETEQRLHEQRERFCSFVESTPDAIVLADHRGHIVTWNRGAHRLFLYTEAEAMGQPLTLLMPIRYRVAHQRGLERFRFTGISRIAGTTVAMHGLRKDGSEFPLELSLAAWKTRTGIAYGGIMRDLTRGRRTAEPPGNAPDDIPRDGPDP